MSESARPESNRRGFIRNAGAATAAASLVTGAMRNVHAADEDTVQVALIGCGGRGTGAASNALSVPDEQVKLVAMVDVFDSKLRSSHRSLVGKFQDKVDVPDDRKFLGFEGYKQAMDHLRPGDVVILTTPLAFRGIMFEYAIEKGLNVFMEKPVTADGPSAKRMLSLASKADEKNLKVGVGLMCRHCEARGELFNRIQDGEIGDILMLRAYRMAGPTGSASVPPNPGNMNDLMYQIANFHGFLWLSGGAFSDFLIHNIDECCWMKNAWPVEAKASGGRHYRGDKVDQNFDVYSVEYTFEDGAKLLLDGRTQPGCHKEFASYAHGSKSAATISASSHWPSSARIYKGQKFSRREVAWEFGQERNNPYQVEWNDFLDAIRNDKPYNEVERGVYASAVTSMGRMAAHTGQTITLDEMMECEHEFAPDVQHLTAESDSPLMPKADGTYSIPMPGLVVDREYA